MEAEQLGTLSKYVRNKKGVAVYKIWESSCAFQGAKWGIWKGQMG